MVNNNTNSEQLIKENEVEKLEIEKANLALELNLRTEQKSQLKKKVKRSGERPRWS